MKNLQRVGWLGVSLWLMLMTSLSAQSLRHEGDFMASASSMVNQVSVVSLVQVLELAETSKMKVWELPVLPNSELKVSMTTAQREAWVEQWRAQELQLLGLVLPTENGQSLKDWSQQLREVLRLSHDLGGNGVRIELQASWLEQAELKLLLKELAEESMGLGQELRVQVQGEAAQIRLFELFKELNQSQLKWAFSVSAQASAAEVKQTFESGKEWLGNAVMIEQGTTAEAPGWNALADLLVAQDYAGWVCAWNATAVEDLEGALIRNRATWERYLLQARKL